MKTVLRRDPEYVTICILHGHDMATNTGR